MLIQLLDRLENEHVGNMDQYRVSKEVCNSSPFSTITRNLYTCRQVPLPYSFDHPTAQDTGDDDDEDDDDDDDNR